MDGWMSHRRVAPPTTPVWAWLTNKRRASIKVADVRGIMGEIQLFNNLKCWYFLFVIFIANRISPAVEFGNKTD